MASTKSDKSWIALAGVDAGAKILEMCVDGARGWAADSDTVPNKNADIRSALRIGLVHRIR
jgi:hypothetical protein